MNLLENYDYYIEMQISLIKVVHKQFMNDYKYHDYRLKPRPDFINFTRISLN